MIEVMGLTIHWYGILIGLGVWLALEIALRRKKKKAEKKEVEDIFFWVVLAGVIGARIYHVIDFWSRYYSHNPMKVFYIWEGGLGIWGAIGGAMLGSYIYCRWKKISFVPMMDGLIVGVPLAQAIGRLGNWVNGELVGKNGEPLFAYEAGLNLLLFAILWKVSQKKTGAGKLTGIYLLGYGFIRILLEGLRPDGIIWKIGGVPTAVIFGVISIVVGLYLTMPKSQN